MNNKQTQNIEDKFISELKHHLNGLREKVDGDFNKDAFEKELTSLKSDPIYPAFGLATDEYTLIRLMGRISVSIGRRLGEIYDKIPRLIAKTSFDIPAERCAPKMGGKLELDICIPFDVITEENKKHVIATTEPFTKKVSKNGLGIEIRYNFNPNDSARLRKDVDMANYIINDNLTPIYLIFSSISPRDEAIARLKRAGWIFIVGEDAVNYTHKLFKIDMAGILNKESVRKEIEKEINSIMKSLYTSYGTKKVFKKYSPYFSA
ncbi:MAG: hypothetical protein LLG05_14280 [Porphyromonadaceae bacterium]|nr:hypothetical protein [Porphyromonadaceae bacterium]